MTAGPLAAAQLAAIGRLSAALAARGVEHWFFGGWAVDLHLGRVTREHGDVDVAVREVDRDAVGTVLSAAGWKPVPDPEADGWATYEHGAVRLDVTWLARDEDGTAYTPLAVGRGEWPPGSFGEEHGGVDGVRVPVVGRASLVADKSGPRDDPAAAAKDRADVARLSATDPVA